MEYYFRTEELSVGYHGVPLIQDIEMSLQRGEILTLIGPNGSGKSTILKSVTKHLKKLGGKVYMENCDLDGLSYKEIAKKLAVVLTERIRPEMMSCWDLVSTGRYPYTGRMGVLSEKDKQIVRASMERVKAYELRNAGFDEISDGQRQRILLARAICQEPDIIVLDEPTSFLDVKHKLELLDILKDMAKNHNITVVMSLHEIDLAQKISDKVMCVKGDRISHYGLPEEIFCDRLIRELYDIEKGSYNVHFGSVELTKPKGEASLFVLAGNGTGVKVFRELQKREIPFYTGVLHENDIDYQVAASLSQTVFWEKAFRRIGEEAIEEAKKALKNCKCLLYTGVELEEMNEGNRRLLETAKHLGIPIVEKVEEFCILEKEQNPYSEQRAG